MKKFAVLVTLLTLLWGANVFGAGADGIDAASAYPEALDTLTDTCDTTACQNEVNSECAKNCWDTTDATGGSGDDIFSDFIEIHSDAIIELETKVGYSDTEPTDGKILIGGSSAGTSVWQTVSGDIVITNAGATAIQDNAVQLDDIEAAARAGDLVGTAPITIDGGTNTDNVLITADGDVTIAINDAAADGATKGAATFNADDFNAASGVVSIDNTNFNMDDMSDGSTNAAITLAQETNFETAYTHSQDNTQAHTDYMLNSGDIATGDYDFGGATTLEVPNANDISTIVNSVGEIGVDADDDQFWVDLSGDILKFDVTGCTDTQIFKFSNSLGLFQCGDDDTAGSPILSSVGDPDGPTSFTLQATESVTFTGSVATGENNWFTVQNTSAAQAGQTWLMDLDHSAADDADTNADYLICQDVGGEVFAIEEDGNTTIVGTLTVGGAVDLNGQVDIGDNGDTASINTSDWDIDATGTITNASMSADQISAGALDIDANTFTVNSIEIVGADGEVNAAAVEQNAGTDITADLEEESHCSEHDSADIDCSGETIVIAADVVDGAELVDDITVDGTGLTIGDGGSTNYTTISTTGAISQAGSATITLQDGSDLVISANDNAGPLLSATQSDTMVGTLTSDGVTIGDDELITTGGYTIQNDVSGGADQFLITTTNTAATATTDPMVQILVGTTPTENQQVFGVAKGTQGSNTDIMTVDEDGDTVLAGDLDVTNVTADSATVSGDFNVNNGSIGGGYIDIFEDSDLGTDYIRIIAPDVDDVAGSYTLTLPTTDGTADQILSTNGTGTLSWVAPSAGTGDVTTVGDCGGPNCLTGSSGEGSTFGLHDGSNKVDFTLANITVDRTVTIPDSDESIGTATDIALDTSGDFGDQNVTSAAIIYGFDNNIYLDLSDDGDMDIVADDDVIVTSTDWSVDALGDMTVNSVTTPAINSAADLTVTPTGNDVLIDGGLTVGSATQAGDNNLRVEGTSALVGVATFTAAPVLPADSVDDITEIAAALKTGSDETLVTGTAGSANKVAIWDANGDAVTGTISDTSGAVSGVTTLGVSDAITLSDGLTIDQSANNVLSIAENSEDIEFTFASDDIAVSSTSGVAAVDFGTINLETDALDVSSGAITNAGAVSGVTTLSMSGDLTANNAASDFTLGNGTADQTQNGGDAFISGTLEVDGNLYADGGITSSATEDPYISFNSTQAGADHWINVDGSADTIEISRSGTIGTDVILKMDETNGTVTVGGGDTGVDYKFQINGEDSDMICEWDEDNEYIKLYTDDTTNEEQLIIELDTATDNEIGIDTGTGTPADTINFNALNLTTTGVILGKVDISTDNGFLDAECTGSGVPNSCCTGAGTGACTATTLTETQMGGGFRTNTWNQAQYWNLPEITASNTGMSACFYSVGGGGNNDNLYINPHDNDYIIFQKAQFGAGDMIQIEGATDSLDDFACVITISATQWSVISYRGPWADGD